MEFLCTDADFSTKTKFKTISKTSGRIHIDTGCINSIYKKACIFLVFSDNTFRMMSRITGNMIYGFFQRIHYPDGKYQITIFCTPVCLHCRNGMRPQGTYSFITPDFHSAGFQFRKHLLHCSISCILMDKKGFHGIAY